MCFCYCETLLPLSGNHNNFAMGWFAKTKVLILVLSTILCCCQIIVLTVEFVKMRVLTKIDLRIPTTVKVPALVICQSHAVFVDYDRLKANHPWFIEKINEKYSVNAQNFSAFLKVDSRTHGFVKNLITTNLTVNQLLEISFSPDEVFPIFAVRNWRNMTVNAPDIEKQCTQLAYVKGGQTCYLFSCGTGVFSTKRVTAEGKAILLAFLTQKIINRTDFLDVYLHSPSRPIRDWRSVPLHLPIDDEKAKWLSYERMEARLLKWPYETECIDYSQEKFGSKFHKTEVCENSLFMERFGFSFPEATRFSDDNTVVGPAKLGPEYDTTVNEIQEFCEGQSHRPDCFEEFYTPRLVSGMKMEYAFSSSVFLVSSLAPEIIKYSLPKSDFIEYITLVCSTVGFWFGFSVALSSIEILSKLKGKRFKLSIIRKRKHQRALNAEMEPI